MYTWNAKVHKTGSKVAIFNGTKLVKMVEASADTFEPAEAQKFAEELVRELSAKTSAQMPSTSAAPSVETKAESHAADLAAVNTEATGKAPHMKSEEVAAPAPAAVIAEEVVVEAKKEPVAEPAKEDIDLEKEASSKNVIATLQKKLAQEKLERHIERKARRGLAIVQKMVVASHLENSYDVIRNKTAEITALEDCEIDRLERIANNESEFDSIESASLEARRLARITRMYRQAAVDAQQDGDEKDAETQDKLADETEAKTAHIEQVIIDMKKAADEAAKEEKETPAEEAKETPATEVKEAAKKCEKCDKEVCECNKEAAKETPAEEKKEPAAEEAKETPAEEAKEEEKDASLETLARKYRRIASEHRKLAAKAEEEGDIEKADKEDGHADAAEDKAEEIENKMAEEKVKEPVTEEAVEPEEKKEAAAETEETPAEEAKETSEEAKEHKEPKGASKVSNANPLKREGDDVVDSFGIDKNASLVEQNDYANDPEVELLSGMWSFGAKAIQGEEHSSR